VSDARRRSGKRAFSFCFVVRKTTKRRMQISRYFEVNAVLKGVLSYILWADQRKEAPKWSEG
jgi:hypothetical protein